MNGKERKTIKKSVQTIKGAIVGGGFGVVVAIATRKNPVVLGVLGLILGRIIFKFNK